MNIQVHKKGAGPFKMEAKNEGGSSLPLDGSTAIGGNEEGFRPMELLLASLGGCSSIDIMNILYKQGYEVEALDVNIQGARKEGEVPALFRNIHVTFHYKGNAPENKLKRAVDLSMEKYCSATKTLEATADITYEFQVEQ